MKTTPGHIRISDAMWERLHPDEGYTMHIDYGQIWITASDGHEVDRWIIKDYGRPSAHQLAGERLASLNSEDES